MWQGDPSSLSKERNTGLDPLSGEELLQNPKPIVRLYSGNTGLDLIEWYDIIYFKKYYKNLCVLSIAGPIYLKFWTVQKMPFPWIFHANSQLF